MNLPRTPTEPSEIDPDPIRLDATNGASAEITSHGAQVLSWACGGKERLFVGPRTTFMAGRAIRGGIPVIFPQFAERGPGVRHGFARLMAWEPFPCSDSTEADITQARFELRVNEYTMQNWPYRFRAEVCVTLASDELSVDLRIENLDKKDFAFTAALHTYLRVSNVGAVTLSGLESHPYQDSAMGGRQCVGPDHPLRFDGEVDRIYPTASGDLLLRDGPETLLIRSQGFTDTVIWNPGRTLAAGMSDLGADQFAHFVCVESAVITTPCVLAAGAAWQASQHLLIAS